MRSVAGLIPLALVGICARATGYLAKVGDIWRERAAAARLFAIRPLSMVTSIKEGDNPTIAAAA